jgi:hypothetical protein
VTVVERRIFTFVFLLVLHVPPQVIYLCVLSGDNKVALCLEGNGYGEQIVFESSESLFHFELFLFTMVYFDEIQVTFGDQKVIHVMHFFF